LPVDDIKASTQLSRVLNENGGVSHPSDFDTAIQ
jgi:hypothetical protein